MVDLLFKFQSDVNWIIDKENGFTILMQFCSQQKDENPYKEKIREEIIVFLLERGADPFLRSVSSNQNSFELALKYSGNDNLTNILQITK